MVVGQSDVDDLDIRRRQIAACSDYVEQPAELVCRDRHLDVEPVAAEKVDQPHRTHVVSTIESNIQVADQVHRFCPRCYRVEQVSQFIEERWLHWFRTRTVNRDDSADVAVDVMLTRGRGR